MTTGQRIKAARKKAGMTQKEIAEKAGTATGTIQQYELGKRQPRPSCRSSRPSAARMEGFIKEVLER